MQKKHIKIFPSQLSVRAFSESKWNHLFLASTGDGSPDSSHFRLPTAIDVIGVRNVIFFEVQVRTYACMYVCVCMYVLELLIWHI